MMTVMQRFMIMLLPLMLLPACKPKGEPLAWELVETHPHQIDCYTQGLEFYEGLLLESGGQYGESKLRRVDPKTGKVIKERRLPAQIFSEGLTVANGELWALTWKAGKAYVFNPKNFDLIRTHAYQGEGWGICTDGTHLIMSDGSASLQFRDPVDFSAVKDLQVTLNGKPQENLNELEYVDGVIYANVYKKDVIVRIDAKSGEVTGVLNLSDLRDRLVEEEARAEVLNGIAHHPETGHLWVTGKYWSQMFEIRVLGP